MSTQQACVASRHPVCPLLPPGLGLGPGGWTLCEASVVRVEKSDGKGMGIAATLDRIALLPEIT